MCPVPGREGQHVLTCQQAWLSAKIARRRCPVAAPLTHSIQAAVKIASAGLYG